MAVSPVSRLTPFPGGNGRTQAVILHRQSDARHVDMVAHALSGRGSTSGTEGDAEDAEWLIPRYESVDFFEKYRAVIHLFPEEPSSILDVGAGTGADAAWLAQKAHRVVAVEPVAAFREAGLELHPSPRINGLATVCQGC